MQIAWFRAIPHIIHGVNLVHLIVLKLIKLTRRRLISTKLMWSGLYGTRWMANILATYLRYKTLSRMNQELDFPVLSFRLVCPLQALENRVSPIENFARPFLPPPRIQSHLSMGLKSIS